MDIVSLVGFSVILLGVFLWVTTLGLRRSLEAFFPALKTSNVWRNAVLPHIPPVAGGVLVLGVKQFPLPEALAAVADVGLIRFMLGAVVGYLSGSIYRAVVAKGEAALNAAPSPPSHDP
jgi:hypothetical protein